MKNQDLFFFHYTIIMIPVQKAISDIPHMDASTFINQQLNEYIF